MERPSRKLFLGLAIVVAALALLMYCGKIGIDRRDEHGMTSLMHAAEDGDTAEVNRLIAAGANVNARVPTRDLRELIAFISWMQQLPKSDIGYTPLHYAVQGGHVEVARRLIDRGADVHQVDRGGQSALGLAIWRSDVEMMTLLTEAGARVTPREFGMAVVHSTPQAVAFLLEHEADPNAIPKPSSRKSGRPLLPPVILATQRGDPAVLELLIEAGADVSAKDQNGWSSLRWAKRSRSSRQPQDMKRIIHLLERAGAEDGPGERAAMLFDAVLKKDAGRVRQALRAGADANARDDRGVPPLIYAGAHGQTEIVTALIEAGADVNASPEHDTTPLISAITGGSIEAVRKLLEAGAKIDQADRLRRTPLQVASQWKRTEITSLLLASSATVDSSALPMAALNGSLDQVRLLLAAGADPNAGNGHALHEAARGCYRRDNTETIRLLLEGGARPGTEKQEYTPLHRAAGLCSPEAVRLLLRRGANPNARDGSGVTPLISAAASGQLENVRLLLDSGADVNARDTYAKSALDHAANYPDVQQELLRAGAR